jgi:hypothetical protein
MMNVQARSVRFMAMMAFGLLISAMSGPVRPVLAETVRDACADDAFRLCSDAIPDVAKTKRCLARNRSSLSPLCRKAFSGGATHGRRYRRHR